MKRSSLASILLIGLLFSTSFAQADEEVSNAPIPAATPTAQEQLRIEIEKLKEQVKALESRLSKEEAKNDTEVQTTAKTEEAINAISDNQAKTDEKIKDINRRVLKTERDNALQRIRFSGDYRFEAHSIRATQPARFDGMRLQNLLVKSMFSMNVLGRPPMSVDEINQTIAGNYSDYQYFTSNLTFDQLRTAMGNFPPELQQQLFGLLLPETFVPERKANNSILYTNRFRLNLDSQVTENMSFHARLSMYKVWGDSTGVQVFNGQPTSLNVDGTTAGVPNSDQIRVDRAYFSWNNMGGSNFFLSIGRRPSSNGPPLNYREDELRGGTPSGALIDYQFDGITFGYKLGNNTILRFCYGLGYESGFGNGDLIKMPSDRLKDVHFLGGNFDIWSSDGWLIQATLARAFNVTDGFNGLTVLPNNPLTGDEIGAPLVMRFTPSTNLGNINLAGVTVTRSYKQFDLFGSLNYSGVRPNGDSTPFGGLLSDPFDIAVDRDGYMIYLGARFRFGEDEKTKLGFEFNHGSKYWFNFAQAQDDIIAPKTNTRGEVFEVYLTHRINSRFILKGNYINYNYRYSGSGWHLGAPQSLDSTPILGFPTYKDAQVLSASTILRF